MLLVIARKHERRLDPSYDLTNDGHVDPLELMIASLLDVNKDGKLSAEEKSNASALIDRIREHYVIGLESHGPSAHGFRIHQRDGKVLLGGGEYHQNGIAELLAPIAASVAASRERTPASEPPTVDAAAAAAASSTTPSVRLPRPVSATALHRSATAESFPVPRTTTPCMFD